MVWLAITLIATGLSAHMTGRFNRTPSLPLKILVILVLFAAYLSITVHLVATEELLGIIGAVRISYVAMHACLIAAVVTLVSVAAIRAGVPAVGAFDLRGSASETAPYVPSNLIIAIFVICAASWLTFFVNAIAAYAFGYDGLAYHLPMVLTWLNEGSLGIPESRRWNFSLPSNGEIGMWLILSAGLDRFAFLFNLFATLGGAIAVFLLARLASERIESAFLAAAFFLMIPVVQFQATSAYIDIYGTSFVLAGIALFCFRNGRVGGAPDPRHYAQIVALTGLAWGIAVGTKHIYYVYGALCCGGALVVIWYETRGRFSRAAALGVLLVACMLLPSSFWLLRALFTTGNPLYPVAVSIFGSPALEGYTLTDITRGALLQDGFVRTSLEWLVYPWVEYRDNGHPLGTGSGVGPAWATFVPLSIVFAIAFAARNYRNGRAQLCIWLLVLIFTMAGVWWFGLRRLPRYGILFVALACVLTGPFLDYLSERRPKAFQVLVLLSFATSAVLSTSVPGHQFLGLIRSNVWSRAEVLEIPSMLDDLPERSVIWLPTGDENLTFALAGARLTNRVIVSRPMDAAAASEFIQQNRINYVADRAPITFDVVASLGAKLLFHGQVGPTHIWKIWEIPPGAPDLAHD